MRWAIEHSLERFFIFKVRSCMHCICCCFFVAEKGPFFGGKRPLLCGGYALLSRHELCHIYAFFWSGFDADFYADIEDFVHFSAQKNARWKLWLCTNNKKGPYFVTESLFH